jgi:hypothetical protein
MLFSIRPAWFLQGTDGSNRPRCREMRLRHVHPLGKDRVIAGIDCWREGRPVSARPSHVFFVID